MKRNVALFISISALLFSCAGSPSASTSSLSSSVVESQPSSSESSSSSSTSSSSSSSISSSSDSSLSSGSSKTEEKKYADEKWKVPVTEYGNTFRGSLQKLIKASGNKTIAYKANNDVLAGSDASPNKSGYVTPFYHSENEPAKATWNTIINKEHVWPNSRGAGEAGLGADPQMLRPTLSADNNGRGNNFYGLSGDGAVFDPGSLKYLPARGEAARIIFYCATKYYGTCGSGGNIKSNNAIELSNNPSASMASNQMGRLDRLLQWNRDYPVTASEIRRNEYLDKAGFSRNPFIDCPDLANYIWSETSLRNSAYTPGSYMKKDTLKLTINTNLSFLVSPLYLSLEQRESL